MHRDEHPCACQFMKASQPKCPAAVRGAMEERLTYSYLTESALGQAMESNDPHCWEYCTDQGANVEVLRLPCPMARRM